MTASTTTDDRDLGSVWLRDMEDWRRLVRADVSYDGRTLVLLVEGKLRIDVCEALERVDDERLRGIQEVLAWECGQRRRRGRGRWPSRSLLMDMAVGGEE